MSRKALKPVLTVLILTLSIFAFIYLLIADKSLRHQLEHISLFKLLIIFGLYSLTLLAMASVTVATLRLCNIKSYKLESLLLTCYSAVVNFFGPLQSGPAVRAVYLKKKYNINLKKYTSATLIYFFFWALFSGLFLLYGLLKWWLIPLIIVGYIILYTLKQKPFIDKRLKVINLHSWYLLALATLLQVSLNAVIYYVELGIVSPNTSIHQAIIYTGAANFALFVSITPGAIGFRETFLIFSKHLHHISTNTIIAANIIDRSIYIFFLLVVGLIVIITHTSKYLGINRKSTIDNIS